MAETSKIQWTDSTFNPWRGCTKVSPGCKFCYAERGAARNPKVLGEWGPEGTRVLAADATWREPVKWSRQEGERGVGLRRLVFCASLADVFEDWPGQMTDPQERPLWVDHEGRPSGIEAFGVPCSLGHARARLWDLIRATPHLIWQVLTKRPENIGNMMPHGDWPNVWLGTSIEDQEYAWRVDALAEAPQNVPVRFVSAEPLLGPLSLWRPLEQRVIQWVIVGGESGGEARPMYLAWVRNLIQECRSWNTACFVKQMGKVAVDTRPSDRIMYALPLVNDPGHGGDWDDWPEDLRVREMPQ